MLGPKMPKVAQDGDALFLNPGGILINNQPLAAASVLEQFAAMELAGMGQFQALALGLASEIHHVQ